MDHDDETRGRIYSRREALERVGATGLTLLLGNAVGIAGPLNQVQSGTGHEHEKTFLVATPELTEGPFFEDGMLNRSNLLEGTDRPSVINGLPLVVEANVYELSGKKGRPLPRAQVDVWQTDAIGVYSDEPNGGNGENTVGQTWLRGYQVTGKSGLVKFQTIWPGWYPGRTIHIHFKVRIAVGSNHYDFTSQFFMADALNDVVMANPPYNSRGNRSTRNANDGIYQTRQVDGSRAGDHLLLSVADNPSGGKIGRFSIAFDMDGL